MAEVGIFRSFFVIATTMLLAILLMLLPLPDWLQWFWPRWIVLFTIFWAMSLPSVFGVGWAWLIGLLTDLLQGTLIGEQALTLAIVAYIVVKMNSAIRQFSGTQKVVLVFFLVVFYQVVLFAIQFWFANAKLHWYFWLSPITSALIWPWLAMFLKSYQTRFHLLEPNQRGMMFWRD